MVTAAGADHISIDPQDAMEEYLADQLPRPLAEVLKSSRAFGYLAAATPGLRELLTAGKLWELAQDERRTPGAEPYDLVVVDAPATGHGIALLAAPSTFAQAARVGPIARQGAIIAQMLRDPARTAVVAVTTAEEMPVNETLVLRDGLRDAVGLEPALVVVNGVRPDRFTNAEAEALTRRRDALADDAAPNAANVDTAQGEAGSRAASATGVRGEIAALDAALAAHAVARAQRAQLARLRRQVDAPTTTLPLTLPDADVAALAARLERALR